MNEMHTYTYQFMLWILLGVLPLFYRAVMIGLWTSQLRNSKKRKTHLHYLVYFIIHNNLNYLDFFIYLFFYPFIIVYLRLLKDF